MYWHDTQSKNKYNKSNNVIINQTVPREMTKYFWLKSVINKNSFNCNLKGLLSFKSIEKLSKLSLWPSNNTWSKITNFLGVSTNLLVKVVIPRCSEALTKNVIEFDHNKLQQLHINLWTICELNLVLTTSLKLK